MTTTRVGSPFQNVLSQVKDARVVSEKRGTPDTMLGAPTTRELDLDGDGSVDARHTEWKHRAGSRHVLSFLDDAGRPVDTFVSGGKNGWALQAGEPGRVWAHTHQEYGPGEQRRVVNERANSWNGELGSRVTTTVTGTSTKSVFETDQDRNGTLESIHRTEERR